MDSFLDIREDNFSETDERDYREEHYYTQQDREEN